MQISEGITPIILQLLALAVGIALIATAGFWNDHTLAVASGIFFINIFWVTMVLGHDFKAWSFLRNTGPGNTFMIAVIVGNLGFIAVRAIKKLF